MSTQGLRHPSQPFFASMTPGSIPLRALLGARESRERGRNTVAISEPLRGSCVPARPFLACTVDRILCKTAAGSDERGRSSYVEPGIGHRTPPGLLAGRLGPVNCVAAAVFFLLHGGRTNGIVVSIEVCGFHSTRAGIYAADG